MPAVVPICANHPVGLLLGLAESMRVHLDEAARSIGLTPQQAQFLVRLEQPTRMSELAEHKNCDPSSITSLVQRLERDGFVLRETDATDGRARVIKITAAGKRARQKFLDKLGDGSEIIQGLADEQRAGLARLFATT